MSVNSIVNLALLVVGMPPASALPARWTSGPAPQAPAIAPDTLVLPKARPAQMPPPATAPTKGQQTREFLARGVAGVVRTTVMGGYGLFGGDVPPDSEFITDKARKLHRIFPGNTVGAAYAGRPRTPAEQAIPAGPVGEAIDPQQYMPNFVFAGMPFKEDSFPVAAAFDGDNDVDNNARNYVHGSLAGNQKPAVYVHTRTKGEYTVVQYWLYYVDNKFINFHFHDWEATSVYLKKQGDKLVPAFLYTAWHNGGEMIPWSNLALDAQGRPSVRVDPGGHGTLPIHAGDKPKPDGGLTLRHDGTMEVRGKNKGANTGLRFLSDDANVLHADAPEQVRGGSVLDTTYGYDYSRIFGFIKVDNGKTSPGPRGRAVGNPGYEWDNPFHPSLFGYGPPPDYGQLASRSESTARVEGTAPADKPSK